MDDRLTEPQRQQVLSALAESQLIQAIKLYREFTGVGLKEAKDAVEAMQAESRGIAPRATAPSPSGLGGEQKRAIEQELAAGRKINAIKLYREAMGVGLKEAKDAVEAMEAKNGVLSAKFESGKRKGGCFSLLFLVLLPSAFGLWLYCWRASLL